MHRLSFTFLFSFLTIVTLACINEYRTRLDGTVGYYEPSSGLVWVEALDTSAIRTESLFLWQKYSETDSLEYLSDYAAKLIYLAEYEKAKAIYHEIEAITPNRYTTASNLGTIYELMGVPDSGIFWIQKSMDLNPNSHNGSEWIHLKILEFQLSQSEDYSKSILGLDFGNQISPSNTNNIDLLKVQADIRHQLKERLQFVKPENKIVGNIYYDLGNILAQTTDLETALESYYEARRFGFESDLMTTRIAQFESMTYSAKSKAEINDFAKNNMKTVIISLLLFLIACPILLIWLYRKYKKIGLKK